MEIITPANLNDVPQLADLLNLLFTQEADFTPDREKQERGLRLILDSAHVGVILAARDGNHVVGMVSLLFTINTAEGGQVCWLEDMVVRPDRRGDGLGSRLLQSAIEYGRSHGAASAAKCRLVFCAFCINDPNGQRIPEGNVKVNRICHR